MRAHRCWLRSLKTSPCGTRANKRPAKNPKRDQKLPCYTWNLKHKKVIRKVVKNLSKEPQFTNVHWAALLLHMIVDICGAECEQWTSTAAEQQLSQHKKQNGSKCRRLTLEAIVFSARSDNRVKINDFAVLLGTVVNCVVLGDSVKWAECKVNCWSAAWLYFDFLWWLNCHYKWWWVGGDSRGNSGNFKDIRQSYLLQNVLVVVMSAKIQDFEKPTQHAQFHQQNNRPTTGH